MKIRLKYFIFLLYFSFVACSDADVKPVLTKEELITKKFDDRIRTYKNNKIKKCKEKALTRAGKYVHEIMITEFKQLLNDTLVFPEKPVRPPMPENLHLDTIGVEKIRNFEIPTK